VQYYEDIRVRYYVADDKGPYMLQREVVRGIREMRDKNATDDDGYLQIHSTV
jgi:hypothetical protein